MCTFCILVSSIHSISVYLKCSQFVISSPHKLNIEIFWRFLIYVDNFPLLRAQHLKRPCKTTFRSSQGKGPQGKGFLLQSRDLDERRRWHNKWAKPDEQSRQRGKRLFSQLNTSTCVRGGGWGGVRGGGFVRGVKPPALRGARVTQLVIGFLARQFVECYRKFGLGNPFFL